MSEVEAIFESEKGFAMHALLHPTTAPHSTTAPHGTADPDRTGALSSIAAMYRVRLVPAAARLWRVIDADGRVLGHLQSVGDGLAARYAAKRFHVASRDFRDLGEFWSADDAIQTLVFSR